MTEPCRWTLVSVTAGMVVAVARWSVSRGRDVYSIWPDEPAQLAIARFVGGGTPWNMHNHSVWRPLFGTLLAPVYWFTDDPVTVFHTALVLNAVLGGLAAGFLVVVARRLTPMTAWWCGAVAVTVSLLPAVVFTTDFVFAESLVAPLYLATLLSLLRFHATPTLSMGTVAAILSAAAFAAHSRMLPLAVVTLALVALNAVRRRIALRDAAVIGAVTLGTLWLVSAYSTFVVDRLWNEPSTRNSAGGVADQLTNGTALFVSLLGQTWYQLVATLGVVVYGVIVLVRSSRDRAEDVEGVEVRRGDAHVVLATVGACVALSVVFMSDRWRSDQLVYGRYNDAVLTPVVVVGIAVLLRSLPLRRIVAISAVTALCTLSAGGALWVLRREVLSESNGLEPMILGLQPFATSATSIDVLRISSWAAVLTVALGVISAGAAAVAQRVGRPRLAPVAGVAVVAGLGIVGSLRTADILDRSWKGSTGSAAVVELRADVLIDGVPVDFLLPEGSDATNRMMLYQFHLPRNEFTVVASAAEGSAPFVFAQLDGTGSGVAGDDGAKKDGTAELREAGATLIWRDPRGRYGLWER